MTEKTRIQFDLNEDKLREISDLMKLGGVDTRKEFFNNALSLFTWAAKEVQKGRVIASVDEQGQQYTRLHIPALEAARDKRSRQSS